MDAEPSLKSIARLLVVDDEQDITTIIKKGLEGNKILWMNLQIHHKH